MLLSVALNCFGESTAALVCMTFCLSNCSCCCLQVDPDPSALQALTGMGFQQESAAKALQQCRNNQAKAIERLVSWGNAARASTPSTSAMRTGSEPSSSDRLTEPASLGGDSSTQLVSAASLLAQALRSNPAGQH